MTRIGAICIVLDACHYKDQLWSDSRGVQMKLLCVRWSRNAGPSVDL